MIMLMEWKLELGIGPKNLSLPGCTDNLSWSLPDDHVIVMIWVQLGYGHELMRASCVLLPHHWTLLAMILSDHKLGPMGNWGFVMFPQSHQKGEADGVEMKMLMNR
jgi:hypothetical protein